MILASMDGHEAGGGGTAGSLDASRIDAASSSSGPSTAAFLRHAQLDPAVSGYRVTGANVQQLYRSLWSSIFAAVPPAYFLPREIAPTAMHALVFLERCNWKLGAAQKRAVAEINDRRRETMGSLAPSSSSSLSGHSGSPGGASQSTASGKGRAFVPPRQATPPPGIGSEEHLGPDYGLDRKGLPCGHIFQKGETIYRCRDCALDDTCVLCAPCFNASDHEGHNIVFNVSDASGGCCDCGDEEAWKKNVCCSYHSAESQGTPNEPGPSTQNTPYDNDVMMEDGTSEKGKAPERAGERDEPSKSVDNLISNIPADIRDPFVQQLSTIVAFILDTLEHAPTKTKLESGRDAVNQIERQKTLEPAEDLDLLLEDTPTPVGAYTFETASQPRMYAIMLWNDEKHSFRDVIDIVVEATGKSESKAKGVADRIDRHGREIIEISSHISHLYRLAHKFSQIDLTVTVRPAYDVYAEEVAGHVLEFLLDLSSAAFFVARAGQTTSLESTHPFGNLFASAIAMRALIARTLLNDWHRCAPLPHHRMSLDFFDTRNLRQLDGLLLMDHKMWKSGRCNLRGLYMALIGPREIKRAFALRFGAMFAKIVETFILNDREPDHSVRFLAVQIFSVPSIATELVISQDLLFKMLQMLHSIFTGQTSTGVLILPSHRPSVTPQTMLVRQQRCQPILQDLKYVLAADGVQKQIATDTRYLTRFGSFLGLFTDIMPEKRAIAEHVEFETEHWVPVVHLTTYLAYLAKLFGEAYLKATPATLLDMIKIATAKTLEICNSLHENHPKFHDALVFDSVTFNRVGYTTIKYSVETQGVSFYHPMHWLVAEMIKIAARRHDLQDGLYIGDVVKKHLGEDGILRIMDFPLRVIVKLKQIRAGLWVRNGFGVRSQAHHYRDYNIREVTLDQDIFLLQCTLAMCSADRVLVTYAQRMSLLQWMQDGTHDVANVDAKQTLFLAEEFALLLVTLLSETSMAVECSIEEQIRRELVHFLALGQGTFSEITKHISDRLKDHASFEKVLKEVSTYRAPDGSSDLGIFVLKPECFAEVEPYFMHYTRNQRENAEQAVRAQRTSSMPPKDAENFVITPGKKLATCSNTTMHRLLNVFTCPSFPVIIASILGNVEAMSGDSPDGLVDACLQLIMMGLVEREEQFAASLRETQSTHGTLLQVMLRMCQNERFSSASKKLQWILKHASSIDASCGEDLREYFASREPQDGQGLKASAEDKRRAAAKARQAAIMQQFSKQQQSLLDSLDDGLGDEESEEHSGKAQDDDATMEDADPQIALRRKQQEMRRQVLGNCIFCQEDLTSMDSFGRLAHIQNSRIMRCTPRHDARSQEQSLQTPLTLDRNEPSGKRFRTARNSSHSSDGWQGANARNWEGFPAEERRFGFYTSSCGHLMHLDCFDTYCRSIEQRHNQQIARNHPEDLSRSEFICPLCKSLGNVVLPIGKAMHHEAEPLTTLNTMPLSDWIRKINIDILKTDTRHLREDMQELDSGTGCFTHWYAEEAASVVEAAHGSSAGNAVGDKTMRMLTRLCNTLKPMSFQTRPEREAQHERTILSSPARRMYIPEEVVGYTIAALEIAQRGKSPALAGMSAKQDTTQTVADAFGEQSLDLIVALLQSLRQISSLEYSQYDSILRHGLLMRLLPQWGGHDAVRSPLLLRDPLSILIEAAIIIPGSLRQVTVLMFYVQLVQVIFGIAQPSLWPQGGSTAHSRISALRSAFRPGEEDDNNPFSGSDLETIQSTFDDVRGTVSNIIGLVGYARGNITLGIDNLDDASLAKMICTYCLPFLRRAMILQRAMSSIIPALELSSQVDDSQHQSEFLRLMKTLEIPLPRDALSASAARPTALAGLVEGWIKHAYPQLASIFRPLPIEPSPLSTSSKASGGSSLHQHQHGKHPRLQLEHPHIYELIRLPETLTSLLTQCQAMKCKRCGDPPPEPAICLECGELLCFQNFCCQGGTDGRGECNLHLAECGQSVGMFFKIKSNIIVLLYQGKGCFTYSPYLDLHGEIDIGLKKGKIQFLHDARFDELRKQWLQHSLANMIARKIEAVMDQGGWTTM